MPANNRRTFKATKETLKVGKTPEITEGPGLVFKKTLNEALLAGLDSPASFARDFLDVEPFPAQAEVLDAFRDASEANFSAGNRSSKTHSSGIWLLWKAFYQHCSPYTVPEKQTQHNVYKAVSTSLTHSQAKLAWSYALTFAKNSKRFEPFLLDVVHSPFPTIKLRTKDTLGNWVNSEIWARSLAKKGHYLLGESINHLQVDECAYIPNYITLESEVLVMRLADNGGSLFRMSTPNGRNHFFSLYQQGLLGDPRFISRTLTSWMNPYVSRQFLAQQKERMLPAFYAQNVMGEFISLSDFFPIEVVQGLYTDIDYEIPADYDKNGIYVMGADLGAQRDPTSVIVLRVDRAPAEVVYYKELRNAVWKASREFVAAVYGIYNPVRSFIDATGVGAPIVQQLMEEDNLVGVTPFIFGSQTKIDALVRLQDAAQRKKLCFPFCDSTQEIINQLAFYRLDDKNLTQDTVMAFALANLAKESFETKDTLNTELYDDLTFISVRSGGQQVPLDLIGEGMEGPGFMFDLSDDGFFIPRGGSGFDY